MPGLSQLKKFSTDILTLGDEQKIRAARGEVPSTIAIPATIEDRDDSEDFALGMLSVSEEQLSQAEAAAAEQEKEANDFTDITGEADTDENAPQQSPIPSAAKAPNVSDLLAPAADADLGDLDLSEFEEPAQPKEPPKPVEVPIEDLDLNALLAPKAKPQTQKSATPQAQKPAAPQIKHAEPPKAPEEEFPPELQEIFKTPQKPQPAAPKPVAKQTPVMPAKQKISEEPEDLESLDSLEPLEPIEPAAAAPKPAESKQELPNASEDDFAFDGSSINLNEGLPESLMETSVEEEQTTTPPAEESIPESAPEPSPEEAATFQENAEQQAPMEQSTSLDEFDTSALDNLPDFGTGEPIAEQPAAEATAPSTDNATQSAQEVPAQEEAPIEKFDTSALDGMDFSNNNEEPVSDDASAAGATDFELGNFDSTADSTDTFNIPGFSDTTTADFRAQKPQVETPDFSDAKKGDSGKPKNTFTDTEYKRFERNLAEYPLNVRVALEDLVVKNEFTDDAVFAILEKVLRKVPAKQLASDLEKMLDITLDVPRDYERRTAEEYETYKKSVEYQLKNRIIPGAILTTAAAMLIVSLFIIIKTLVFIPVMENSIYRNGYNLLQKNEYPQSEMEFDRALTYKPIKKWFFKYAEGYRDHMQYERATMMYKAVLQRFDHDKQAGLDWANMELYDLFNYSEAERILKREVLDYHISDKDALLLLGDTYLEWGTEKAPLKFDSAMEQYALLMQLYGKKNQDLYLARMMRYYIRTDNLRQVLQFKDHFYPKKKSLNAQDLTELSGYLLDKRYGTLKPAEESLRFSIENVRELIERAVKADPSNPVALYNMGRYFVETANNEAAKTVLKSAKDAFASQRVRNIRDTYKYINTYRLMGEQNCVSRSYIPAEQMYDKGIELFENENQSSGFESTTDIGKLYADLGDLNYFISGQMDASLYNYKKSIENKNDTPSIRYRVGYIQYTNKNYAEALGSFIVSSESKSDDTHLLLALANTLSLRNDNYTAEGYYEKLLAILDKERELHGVLLPQVREDQADLVDTYMRAANNLGVTLNRIALQTGNSKMNAEAIVQLSESLRAWDALTRNQKTMERLKSANLPQENIKYIDHPLSSYTPEIFTEIPRLLNGEKGFE